MILRVRLVPRAARTDVAGWYGDELRIRVKAPPVDGAANEELVRFLARKLRVPRSAVRIVSGHRNRSKRVEVEGVAPDAVDTLLAE